MSHLETALRLVALPYPDLRLGVAAVSGVGVGNRLESSAFLAHFAASPGPFDDYFRTSLIPQLAGLGATHVGVSLTFQQQTPAAFRLATIIREELPSVRLLLGGPLIACFHAVGVALDRSPFSFYDRVVPGSLDDLQALAVELGAGAAPRPTPTAPLSVDLDETDWRQYLAPMPVIPAAFGDGCYWRRCTFCPESLHAAGSRAAEGALAPWLQRIATRFPAGAMIHFTDAAVPMARLEEVATTIIRDRLPIRWHGFVRVEAELARPDFAAHLVRGGCALLQLGVESGSPRLLEIMAKGGSPELSARVLGTTVAAGIHNQVYLLFGLPAETDADRELTLALVTAQADAIQAVNPALLNLPRMSAMHRHPERFGITEIAPFNRGTDLSLYDDFRCGDSHPRLEARRWLSGRFLKSPPLRAMTAGLRSPLKANHLCFF